MANISVRTAQVHFVQERQEGRNISTAYAVDTLLKGSGRNWKMVDPEFASFFLWLWINSIWAFPLVLGLEIRMHHPPTTNEVHHR